MISKKCTKKGISKNITKTCTFSTFTLVCHTCFAYNFFWVWNQHEILRFLYLFYFLSKKKFVWVILVLFPNFEAKRAKFSLKNQIRCTLMGSGCIWYQPHFLWCCPAVVGGCSNSILWQMMLRMVQKLACRLCAPSMYWMGDCRPRSWLRFCR